VALAERTGMSPSQVGRVLSDLDLKPHRVQGWLTRKDDPQFWARAANVCGLYLRPPEGALVLSVDEKTAMSARSPTHPTIPLTPGHPERKEFEYVRHGVVSLMAAFDVHTGQVLVATWNAMTASTSPRSSPTSTSTCTRTRPST